MRYGRPVALRGAASYVRPGAPSGVLGFSLPMFVLSSGPRSTATRHQRVAVALARRDTAVMRLAVENALGEALERRRVTEAELRVAGTVHTILLGTPDVIFLFETGARHLQC
jgi:hypothetical protein